MSENQFYQEPKSISSSKNKDIVIAGSPCLVAHNAAMKVANIFSRTSFDINDRCVNLFHWCEKSNKRKIILKEYFKLCGSEYSEVLEFISTRWLSLKLCMIRELKKFLGIRFYYLFKNFKDKCFQRSYEAFSNTMTEIYLLFFQLVFYLPLKILTNIFKGGYHLFILCFMHNKDLCENWKLNIFYANRLRIRVELDIQN